MKKFFFVLSVIVISSCEEETTKCCYNNIGYKHICENDISYNALTGGIPIEWDSVAVHFESYGYICD